MRKPSYEAYSDLPNHQLDYLVREKFGTTNVYSQSAKSLLTKASGFIAEYDFSLNPYRGCQYGCSYCYAAAFSPNQKMRQNWGQWVIIKENAQALLIKELDRWYQKNPGRSPRIYMSSVTDPYQPLESKHEITRNLLEVMCGYSPTPTLVIQTRSPIIIRDIDYLQRLKRLRINISIPTGSERVRQDFEPSSSSIKTRLNILKRIRHSIDPSKGFIPKLSITITPLLPTFPEEQNIFIEQLDIADRIVIQDFHLQKKSSLAASTRQEVVAIKEKYDWWYKDSTKNYQDFQQKLIKKLPHVEILEGKKGFGYE